MALRLCLSMLQTLDSLLFETVDDYVLLFCDTYDIAVRTCISELLQFTLSLSFLPTECLE